MEQAGALFCSNNLQTTNSAFYCSISILCIHKGISCVYTRDLLCMHNFLVHTQKNSLVYTHEISCVYTRDLLCQGPKRAPGRSQALDRARSLVYTQENSFVYAHECCACTRDLLCIHKRFFCVYTRDIEQVGRIFCFGTFFDLTI